MKNISKFLILFFLISFIPLNAKAQDTAGLRLLKMENKLDAMDKKIDDFLEDHEVHEESHTKVLKEYERIKGLDVIYAKTIRSAKIFAWIGAAGIIFVMILIFYTWRSVANVNKNTIEVMMAFEDIKSKLVEIKTGEKILKKIECEYNVKKGNGNNGNSNNGNSKKENGEKVAEEIKKEISPKTQDD